MPPLDDVCTTAAGRMPAPGTARRARRRRRRSRARRVAVLPPIGIECGAAPGRGQLVGELLAGDLQLAPVVRRAADVVQLGAEQLGEQLVAGRPVRAVARQHEVHLQAEHGAGGRRHPAVVGLPGADRDERPGAGPQRLAAQELQLAGLVAAGAEPGEVVALDPQAGAAGQARPALQRRRQRRQPRPGHGVEPLEDVTAPMVCGRREPTRPPSARRTLSSPNSCDGPRTRDQSRRSAGAA